MENEFKAGLKTCLSCGKEYMPAHQSSECPHKRLCDIEPKPDQTTLLAAEETMQFIPTSYRVKPDQSRLLKVIIEERTKNCVGADYGSVKENLEWLVAKTASTKDAEQAKKCEECSDGFISTHEKATNDVRALCEAECQARIEALIDWLLEDVPFKEANKDEVGVPRFMGLHSGNLRETILNFLATHLKGDEG